MELFKTKVVFLILSSLSLGTACAPMTEQKIRLQEKYSQTLTVNESYQDVFARMANQLRQCHFDAPMGPQLTVSADKQNHLKHASVKLTRLYGPVSEQVGFLVDIQQVESGKSRVDIYSTWSYRKTAVAATAWATNESLSCSRAS